MNKKKNKYRRKFVSSLLLAFRAVYTGPRIVQANGVADKLLYWRMCLSHFTRCSFIADSYLQKP